MFMRKVVRVFEKSRTCFSQNMYVFFWEHLRPWFAREKELDYGRNHRHAVNTGKLIIEAWKLKVPILRVAHMIDDGPHLQGRVEAEAFTIADGFEGRQ